MSERAESPTRTPIRCRALVLAALLSLLGIYAVVQLPQSSVTSLLCVPVGLLLLQVAFAGAVAKFTGRTILEFRDHVIVFGVCSLACAIGSEWCFYTQTAVHMGPFLESGSPAVKDAILPGLPDWMIIKQMEPVRQMSVGGDGPAYVWSQAGAFAPRYLAWTALIGSAVLGCLFINALMRDAWLGREKLAFPILQLPIEMSQGGAASMWRSRVMWTAFSIMFAIDLLNGLNYLYPWLPRIGVKTIIETGPFLQDAPWNSMGELPINLYPFMMAIGLFMPNDLLFSVIVFFLLRKFVHVGVGMSGIPQSTFSGTSISPGPPFFEEQAWGAVIAMFVSMIWLSRRALADVWRAIRTGDKNLDGGFSHRTSFIGLLACSAVFMWFGYVGKLPPIYMAAYFALFLIFSVVVTRIRAQLGPPSHEFAFFGPTSILNRFVGSQWMSNEQAAWLGQGFLFANRIHRTHPGPYSIESMQLGVVSKQSLRRLLPTLALVSVLAVFVGYGFYLLKAYRVGNPLATFEGVGATQSLMSNRGPADPMAMGMAGVGFAVAIGLDLLRTRIPGFPLHPVGYVLGITYGVDYYWFGLLVALVCKWFVQRYYGLKGYDKLRHVALGILLAEYLTELIWMTFTLITRQSSYTIGPNVRSLGEQ